MIESAAWTTISVGSSMVPGPLPIGLPVPPEWELVDILSPEAVLGAARRDGSGRCLDSLCFEIRRATRPIDRVITRVRTASSGLTDCVELLPDGVSQPRSDVCWCSATGDRNGESYSTSSVAFEIPVTADAYPRVIVITVGCAEDGSSETSARRSDSVMQEILERLQVGPASQS